MLSNVLLHLIGKQLLRKKKLSAGKVKLITDSKKVEIKGHVISFMEAFTQNSKLENLPFHTLTSRNLLSPYFCI